MQLSEHGLNLLAACPDAPSAHDELAVEDIAVEDITAPPQIVAKSDEGASPPQTVVPLSRTMFNLYKAVVGEYGESGGFGLTSGVRAGPATAWSRREQPKEKLPKDIAREIRRLDQDVFAYRKEGGNIMVQLKKIRQKLR